MIVNTTGEIVKASSTDFNVYDNPLTAVSQSTTTCTGEVVQNN